MPPEESFTREERIALFRGQVETQLNFIKEELTNINKDIKELSETINKRLTILETWKATIAAKASVLAAAFGIAGTLLCNWISSRL